MNRDCTASSGLPVGSPPSESWLFAQAILGNPIPKIVSPESAARAKREELARLADFSEAHARELRQLDAAEAEARRKRASLEWAAQISTRAADKLRALQSQEAAEREAWRRAEQYAEQLLLEAAWDPSQHPRLGGSPNAGWWATTKGGEAGAGETSSSSKDALYPSVSRDALSTQNPPVASAAELSSRRTIAATTAVHSITKGMPVHFAAAQSAGGHHWVPRVVFDALRSRMTKAAYDIFEAGTKSSGVYDHGFDTWNGVTHGQYIGAIRELLEDWIKTKGGMLGEDSAIKFLTWITDGKCGDPSFAAKHKKLFAAVFKWRQGFLRSILIAHAAAEANPNLVGSELKAIAQQIVNGKSTQPLSRAAAQAAKWVIKGGKPLLKAIAKKIIPGLIFLNTAMAAKRGWAGQGHSGDGAWGALNEVTRDLILADVIEPIVFPAVLDTVDGLTNVFAPGLNDRTRNRYLWRNGRYWDMETGKAAD